MTASKRIRTTAIRATVALALVGGYLAAVVWAQGGPFASGRDGLPEGRVAPGSHVDSPRRRPRPPRLVRHPARVSTSADAHFVFAGVRHRHPGPSRVSPRLRRHRRLRFRCKVDRGAAAPCAKRVNLRDLGPGSHTFVVRALNRRGVESIATTFRWRLVEPKRFTIEPRLEGLGDLYPGAPPRSLPVLVTNPNPVPISITALWVSVSSNPPGCPPATNLDLEPASVSSAEPLRVAPHASRALPSPGAGAPTIALKDLPVNQDACQGISFPLTFAGRAHG